LGVIPLAATSETTRLLLAHRIQIAVIPFSVEPVRPRRSDWFHGTAPLNRQTGSVEYHNLQQMNFRFQHTELLIGLAGIGVLILAFYYLLKWKTKVVSRIGDPKLVQQLIKNFSSKAFLLKFVLALVAFTLIVSGAANLQEPGEMDKVQRKGVDVIIAMDVSKSMLAQDIAPNRLERAKQFTNRLISQLGDDRIGLILFAGRAYMQMPLSTDHAMASLYIQQAAPEAVPTQGTVISEALRMSDAAFNRKERKYKAVVLVTDGEDHDPESVQLAQQLASNGIMINTVGIGSPSGSIIPDPETGQPKKDEQGNTVVSKLNEVELQRLASATNGVYVRLNDPADAATKIKAQLDTIQETAMEDNEFRQYKSYFPWFLALAFILLLVEFIVPEKRKEKA
jgi:Ca-activated chloride channel family protein